MYYRIFLPLLVPTEAEAPRRGMLVEFRYLLSWERGVSIAMFGSAYTRGHSGCFPLEFTQ
jgi:hypothetical protein